MDQKGIKIKETHQQLNSWGSFQHYVEWLTDGPNGGTCQRPDIFLNEGKVCNNCEFKEFCKCKNLKIKEIILKNK